MGKIIHIFAHTHWDREWYFTTSRAKVYLMKELSDILDTLECNEKFTSFLIDGQASLIDEYLAWRPQDEDRVRKAVASKRLMVGPWYTQCDQLIISAESVVRNLCYGITRANELGHSMNVGYVPDCFGQGGNMPQIYRAFGIKDAVIVRGVSDDMTSHTNFRWIGSDGSEVLTSQMRTGYSIAEWIPSDPVESDEFWDKVCLQDEAPRFATDHVLFPVGFDQAPIRKNLPHIIADRNQRDPENIYVLDNLEDYTQAVRRTGAKFETVRGELLSGKLRRLHRSIYSSRSDIKALNTWTQNYISNILEPLMTMSWMLGNDYPHKALETVWKLLFENSAHDSIGSCVSDSVNDDIKMRYKQIHDIAVSLVELHSRLIATSIEGTEDRYTITFFNTLPQQRSVVAIKRLYIPGERFSILSQDGRQLKYTVLKKRDLTKYVKRQTINLDPSRHFYTPETIYEADIALETGDLPAFGYSQVVIKPGDTTEDELHPINALENECYRIKINEDGSLRITDKSNGFIYDHEAVLEENGDDGDSFNYSPPRKDMVIRSTSFKPCISLEGSSIIQMADIAYEMMVPADLDERSRGLATTRMPVKISVSLRKGSRVIDISVHVDNRVKSHRLCVLVDSELTTKFNYADELFGSIKRPNYLSEEMEWYKRDQKQGIEWNEVPVAIQPTQTFVSLFNDKRGTALFPQGVREYEIVDDAGEENGEGNIIRLTLFRTYGFMGKENLLYRPGHASGEETIATPAAQLQGCLGFKFGLAFLQSGFEGASLGQLSKEYDSEVQAFEYASFLNGRLMFSEPEITGEATGEDSLLEIRGSLTLSTIKKAENEDGLIVRLYNGQINELASATITFRKPVKKVYMVDLLEREEEQLRIQNSHKVIIGSIAPSRFVTILAKFA